MTKLICFDLWKTLAGEPATLGDYWQPLMAKYPKAVTKHRLAELIDQVPMKKDQDIEKSVEEILNILGIKDQKLIQEVSGRWKTSCNKASMFLESKHVLKGLRKMGYKLALITNTSSYGWQRINTKALLAQDFDYLFLSFIRKFVKPEVKIFEQVELESGVSPSEIAMVGDSYDSDFLPAKQRGWKAILLDRTRQNRNLAIEPVISDLTGLKEFF